MRISTIVTSTLASGAAEDRAQVDRARLQAQEVLNQVALLLVGKP